jgi:hypothetical protein
VLILLLGGVSGYSQLKIDYGKSYINVTKGLNGGTIEPGDILEIRATFVVGGSGANDYLDSCGYFDVIPANTTYVPGSLAILTNEGTVYKTFTDAINDDEGWVQGTNVRINLGYKNAPTATATRRGRIKYNDKPSFYGGTCIMVASFRVKVTGGYGSSISLGGGAITYRPFGFGITDIIFPADSVMIFQNLGICADAGSNAILSEFGGTFGSGKAKNRVASSKVSTNYTYALFGPNSPQDYFYNISNNTSTGGVGYTTSNAWPIPDPTIPASTQSHRVFNVWDIIGDHTGAVNPLLGNPASDTVNSSTGGYMAVINSSYKPGIAFLDTINNLCPNTYYQYYAWFRNICSRCACDSNGVPPGTANYIPTGPGDSSGVHPNLTFNVNGFDYYTSGNILYTGQWVRKGFTYLTGPTQTSMILYIRNNAPGGGGNDWAIDDIGVASCVPQISLTPNKPDTLCMGADDTVRFKVSAYFNNYTEWKLEASTDNGTTWASPGNDTTGAAPTGSAVPVFNPSTSLYEYLVTRYFRLNSVNTKVIYRLTIASTVGNLSNPNCDYITSTPKIIFAVNCNVVLPTSVSLKGQLVNGYSQLQWTSLDETGSVNYTVERSTDGVHFSALATIPGIGQNGAGATYNYNDPQPVSGNAYYRVNIADQQYHTYSRMILLNNGEIAFEIRELVNPFGSSLSFNLTVPESATTSMTVFDAYGRILRREQVPAGAGLTSVKLNGFGNLPTGMYVLQVFYKNQVLTRQVIKRIQ